MTLKTVYQTAGDCQQLGVQLPTADIAHQTQPGLFDHLPPSAFTIDHKTLIKARPGDRMLAALGLPVSNAAKIVGPALAWHGWNAWPSRETISGITGILPQNVSRASKELEKAGCIRRAKRKHRTGAVGIQTTFKGLAIVATVVAQDHPILADAGRRLAKAGNQYDSQRGITLIPEPERDDCAGDKGLESLLVKDRAGCGYPGCPSLGQVCPMCGRETQGEYTITI